MCNLFLNPGVFYKISYLGSGDFMNNLIISFTIKGTNENPITIAQSVKLKLWTPKAVAITGIDITTNWRSIPTIMEPIKNLLKIDQF